MANRRENDSQAIELKLQIVGDEDVDDEILDEMARRLLGELVEIAEIEQVRLKHRSGV